MSAQTNAATVHIPGLYRLFLLYVEPALAVQGAVMCARSPLWYLSVMSPLANRSHYEPVLQVVFDQLAATYLLFAFNQAVVLRIADGHLRVWNAMVFGMLVCDALHVRATYVALGPDLLLHPARWRFYDSFNIAVLFGMAALRIAFLFGVGVKEGGAEETRKKVKAKTG